MLVFAFLWIPFVYFYTQEKEDKADFDSDVKSNFARVISSLKQTVPLIPP